MVAGALGIVRPLDAVSPLAWEGKRVVIVGMARQGKALARYLVGQGARVTLNDHKDAAQLSQARAELEDLDLRYVFGSHPLSLLDHADALFLSGGVPADLELARTARMRSIPVLNDSQLFLEQTPARTVGITGSAGKSTTTALVGAMAQAAGWPVWFGGNLGRPLLLDIDEMTASGLAIMELSSFQLELMSNSPAVAVVLNVTPNHLDRHGDMAHYTAAKARILAFQNESEHAVLGHGDPIAWGLRKMARGQLSSFGWGPPPLGRGAFVAEDHLTLVAGDSERIPVIPSAELGLRGRHNILNALAAMAIGNVLGLPLRAMRTALAEFSGLPHRLEAVAERAGVLWVNDSIATTPERALAGLRAYQRPAVLLLGGRDKGLDWSELAGEACDRCRAVITFGEAAETIAAAFSECRTEPIPPVETAPNLAGAMEAALRQARPGDVVLLSPGGTSFDEFVDFEARGEMFRHLVGQL